MLQIIKSLLQKILSDIDAGNSNISEEEAAKVIEQLKYFADNSRMSKYSACKYLNVSRATFDNYVRDGKLPKGKHAIGFKELHWNKRDLDNFIETCKN